jgi:CRISPR/Cas system-associated endoribonuclease Cas2
VSRVIQVNYDLHWDRKYEPLWTYLRSHGAQRVLASMWVLETTKSARQVIDDLLGLVDDDDDDEVYVFDITGASEWWTNSSHAGTVTWLKAKMPVSHRHAA